MKTPQYEQKSNWLWLPWMREYINMDNVRHVDIHEDRVRVYWVGQIGYGADYYRDDSEAIKAFLERVGYH